MRPRTDCASRAAHCRPCWPGRSPTTTPALVDLARRLDQLETAVDDKHPRRPIRSDHPSPRIRGKHVTVENHPIDDAALRQAMHRCAPRSTRRWWARPAPSPDCSCPSSPGATCSWRESPVSRRPLVVRSFARALGLDTKRVQFTPDLMPGDVTGSLVYYARTGEFDFRAGPVFTTSCSPTRSTARREDPGRTPGGHGGAPGVGGRRQPSPARPVPRRRDAEPHRARRHLFAARGATGSLPDEARRRHAGARRGGVGAAPTRRGLLPSRAHPASRPVVTADEDQGGTAGGRSGRCHRRRARIRRRPRSCDPPVAGPSSWEPAHAPRPVCSAAAKAWAWLIRLFRGHPRPRADDAGSGVASPASSCDPMPRWRRVRDAGAHLRGAADRVPI